MTIVDYESLKLEDLPEYMAENVDILLINEEGTQCDCGESEISPNMEIIKGALLPICPYCNYPKSYNDYDGN